MDNFDLKKYLSEGILDKERSKKRWFAGNDNFKRIIKNIDPSEIEDLIAYTKSNGDEVDEYGNDKWGITPESRENNQSVWAYSDGNLYFSNPQSPSIYDEYIRKM